MTEKTLRDEIAISVIPSVIRECKHDSQLGYKSREHLFAIRAYALADAILEIREVKP